MKLGGQLKGLSIAILTFVSFQMGCRNPDDINKDLNSATANETINFKNLVKVSSENGDATTAFEYWSRSLTSVSNYSQELAALVEKAKPSEKSKYEAKIASLKQQLDSILQRNDSLKLAIPSWNKSSADQWNASVAKSFESIGNSYSKIFGQTPNVSKISITVESDNRFVDTYGSCVALFANESAACKSAAVDGCTHQTEIGCMQRAIQSNSSFNGLACTESVSVGDGSKEKPHSERVTASWLVTAFASCRSPNAILK